MLATTIAINLIKLILTRDIIVKKNSIEKNCANLMIVDDY